MGDRDPRLPVARSMLRPRDEAWTRVDLHLHTAASGEATNWWVKAIGLGEVTRESNTSPEDAYLLAKQAGMDFVAITDHETIDGAEELTGAPGLVVGEEINAIFPEDGSTVDVLVYGLNRAQHELLQSLRSDVYHLVDALRVLDLPHVLAHPLFVPEGRLTRDMIEKRMVLFGLWEVINGSRPPSQNRLAAAIARSADASMLRQLAAGHRLPPPPHDRIAGVAGSDDHGGIYAGSTWTMVPRAESVADLLEALREGVTIPCGQHGSVDRMVHTGIRIAGEALAARGHAEPSDASGRLAALPFLAMLPTSRLREAIGAEYARQVAAALAPAAAMPRLLGLAGMAGRFVEAHMLLAPYLGVSGYFGRERRKARAIEAHLPEVTPPSTVRAGVFIDDFDSTHGVSTFYRAVGSYPSESVELDIVHCGQGDIGLGLPAIAEVPLPMYGDVRLPVPSLLDVIGLIERLELDVVHIAAPGPLGIAAMTAARTLGLPIVGGYHTEFGSYARQLSGDDLVGEAVEVLTRQWYEHCDLVIVPSRATGAALEARGYRLPRVEIISNGVDSAVFAPDRRDAVWRAEAGNGRTLILYAGRISREKGLEAFARGYLALRARRPDLHLVLAGDGPYRAELAALLGDAATFTGMLDRDRLGRIMASCDLFVFPSETDTLGRVVIEAQAAGLPAVVFAGGPAECIVPGCTGFSVARGDQERLLAMIELLVDDVPLRSRMADAAREWACSLDWQGVRRHLDRLYRELAGGGFGQRATADVPVRVADLVASER